MALAVLIFHFDKWLTGTWDASSLQGRLGVYAVSAFFVLSGLTLTLVYENRLSWSFKSWARFFQKRFFRIFPLLWLATAATLLLDDFPRPLSELFLNFTGLFGFINPARDIATGAWSIGCELVFYAGFPTLLLLAQMLRELFLGSFLLFVSIGIWAAFAWFSPAMRNQSVWWEAYTQAANHAFFFAGGMAIGVFKSDMEQLPRKLWPLVLLLSAVAFTFWPTGPEPFYLVSGGNRIVLSTLSLVVVTSFFHASIELKGVLHKGLVWLGTVSYSLYLLHPLVFRATKFAFVKIGIRDEYWTLFIPTLLAALALSHFSYYFLEKPMMKRA